MDPIVIVTLAWIVFFGLIDASLWISYAAKKKQNDPKPETKELKQIESSAFAFALIAGVPPTLFWMWLLSG